MNWSVPYYTTKGGKRNHYSSMSDGELTNCRANLVTAIHAARERLGQLEAEQRGADDERKQRLDAKVAQRLREKIDRMNVKAVAPKIRSVDSSARKFKA